MEMFLNHIGSDFMDYFIYLDPGNCKGSVSLSLACLVYVFLLEQVLLPVYSKGKGIPVLCRKLRSSGGLAGVLSC
ncbi:hypothetical protein ACP4OV_015227 [Aristida adscensionis]